MASGNIKTKCEAIVTEINAELHGTGSIDLAFVAIVRSGMAENVSHPIVQRIQAALKERGL